MFDVITCGSATVDVFAESDSELVTRQTHDHTENLIAFPVGEKILVRKLQYSIGGGGTNTAVGFSRQKLITGWVGCLGDGTNAELVVKSLREEHVISLGHITSRCETGYSFIMNALNNDRTILAYKGANNELTYAQLRLSQLQAKCFYFSSMVGKSYETQKKLAAHAKKQGALIVFNPSSYQVKEGWNKLIPMLKNTDILIFNKEESEILCETCELSGIFARLHEVGVSQVIITNGPDTFYASDKGKLYKITPADVKPLETTGAGDAFACGFVGMFLQTSDFPKSLKSGVVNAQSVIQYSGAKEKLLSLRQLKSRSKSAKIKIQKL